MSNEIMLRTYVAVFLGGGIGSVLRFTLSVAIANRVGEYFPWGTMAVNVTGCFLIGLLATLFGVDGRWMVAPDIRQFLMIGILGGYTTFSSFSLQTLMLAKDGEWLYAGANVLLSVILCLVGVWIGFIAGNNINGFK